MSRPSEPSLRARNDDYSHQVASAVDPRFWFRLERKPDRDMITDYFLGSFPRDRAATLLEDCYGVLGLSPKSTIVFRDIRPGVRVNPGQALDAARDLYLEAGTALLFGAGAGKVSHRLDLELDKYSLTLVAE
jgi:hypothetical protein